MKTYENKTHDELVAEAIDLIINCKDEEILKKALEAALKVK